jgi:DNA-binding transcriptional LysR family regulator
MSNGKKIDFLRALEIFLATAEHRGVTAAAKSLGLAQSAVSQTLQQLEGELGQPLFDRAVRPMALTSAGAVLRVRAMQLVAEAAETRALVRGVGGVGLPQLRLAVIGSLAGTLVPPLVTTLTERTGIADISVWRGLATTNENALLSRDVDMLVTSDALYEVDGLQRFVLFREPYIVIAPPGALKGGKGTLAALAERLPHIRYTRRTQMGWAIETQLKRLGAALPGGLEFDSSEDVVATVAAGRGFAVSVPSHVLHGLRGGATVDSAPFPGPGFSREVNLVVRAAELGAVPAEVHRLCLEVLSTDFAPRIHAAVPWLGDGFAVASAGEGH